jgi:predicted phosphohydrolase
MLVTSTYNYLSLNEYFISTTHVPPLSTGQRRATFLNLIETGDESKVLFGYVILATHLDNRLTN